MKCFLLDIEMPIGNACPSPFNNDGFKYSNECGCADNPELINEKAENWEKFKNGTLTEKLTGKNGVQNMELEKIGTKTLSGTYIIEGNLVYIEQEEKGKVTVVTVSGISEVVTIGELQEFIDNRSMHDDIKEELKMIISKII